MKNKCYIIISMLLCSFWAWPSVANELMYEYQSEGGNAMIIGPSGYLTNAPNFDWLRSQAIGSRYESIGLVGFQAYDSSVLLHKFKLNCVNHTFRRYRATHKSKEQRAIVSFGNYFISRLNFVTEDIAICRPKNSDMLHWDELFNFGKDTVRINRLGNVVYTVFESGLLVFYFDRDEEINPLDPLARD